MIVIVGVSGGKDSFKTGFSGFETDLDYDHY